MRNHWLVLLLLGTWVCLVPRAAFAQTTGTIAGTVRDTTGAVLPGVTVEASSPALIEKTRTAVSDGSGNYKIIDLRPGTYAVTFTLAGFGTFRREGIELSAGFTATAHAELKVGSLEESVTVTGASPVVDVQNTRTQAVMKAEVLEALPTGMKDLWQIAALTLGANPVSAATRNDVGGSTGEMSTGISIHGSRGDDGRTNYDGMNTNNFYGGAGGQQRVYKFNTVAVAETTLDTGGNSADTETGGANVNMVPKDGGNTFRVFGSASYTTKRWSSGTVPDDLVARGTAQGQNSVKRIWDYGAGLGGPLMRDRIWFYAANRWWGNEAYQTNIYYDKSTNPSFYVPDLGRPAFGTSIQRDNGGRITWQVSGKHKIAGSFHEQRGEQLQFLGFQSPDSAIYFLYDPLFLNQVTWNYPRTNRLLFQAGASFLLQQTSFSNERIPGPGVHAIVETIGVPGGAPAGFTYGTMNVAQTFLDYGTDPHTQDNFTQKVSMSYVTGSHNIKAGLDLLQGIFATRGNVLPDGLAYTFRGGVPVSLNMWATPFRNDVRVRSQGVFLQDQWTVRRFTVNGGVRFDHGYAFVLPVSIPAGPFIGARSFPGVKDLPNYKDVTARTGVAYDVFGNGKTAIKFSWGKYIQGIGGGDANNNSPANAITTNTSRTWNDGFYPVGDPRRGNFVPDCALMDLASNGECGPANNTNFGKPIQTTTWLPATRIGWGKREFNYQTSVVLQHELMPRFGVTLGYFRTDWRNQKITVNELVAPGDFTPFCVTAPTDSRLPGGGGYQVCGLRNLVPAKLGQVRNVVDTVYKYGSGPKDIFNGMDIGFNLRWGTKGAMLAGGTAFGRQLSDTCYLNDRPDIGGGNRTFGYDSSLNSCRTVRPLWAGGGQVKFQAVYPLPWDFQLSGTYRNTPGIEQAAVLTMTNAQVAPFLGRSLSGCPATGACTATMNVPMIQAGAWFDKRFSELDMRFTRRFTIGRSRLMANFELYNVLNDRPPTGVSNAYGTATWLRPSNIGGGRMFKLGGQFEL